MIVATTGRRGRRLRRSSAPWKVIAPPVVGSPYALVTKTTSCCPKAVANRRALPVATPRPDVEAPALDRADVAGAVHRTV